MGKRGRGERTGRSAFGALALGVVLGCGRGGAPQSLASSDGGAGSAGAASRTSALDALVGPVGLGVAKAENLRRVRDLPEAARDAHDLPTRRGVARALARIGGEESVPGLLRALGDEDAETVAWAAYGLGFFCKDSGHAKERVLALAARVASLPVAAGDGGNGRTGGPGGTGKRGAADALDAPTTIVRAVGKCGGEEAESLLFAWLRDPTYSRGAALGLGDAVVGGQKLAEPTLAELIDVATGSASEAPLDEAFYPLARLPAASPLKPEMAARLVAAARAALAARTKAATSTSPGDSYRLQAIRALRHVGTLGIADLEAVITPSADAGEASEAARALGSLSGGDGAAAQEALGRAIARLTVGTNDPMALLALAGDGFGPLSTALHELRDPAPPAMNATLLQLTKLRAPGAAAPAPLERRLADLRCTAASLLARGAYDAEVLTSCAADGTLAKTRARLETLVRRPLVADRKTAYRALARDPHVVVREAALEAIGAHPELGDAAVAALEGALADSLDQTTTGPRVGLAAVAAKVLAEHPDRALAISARERRAALDPSSPPPSATPEMQVDPRLQARLEAALVFAWPPAAIETRANLLDAATALHLPSAATTAARFCRDPNPVIREHATRSLRSMEPTAAACAPGDAPPLATELAHPPADPNGTRRTRLVFVTDAGELTVHLDPSLAPVAALHFADLARSGIYKNTEMHRVVPGFVDQFGDPGGDGYGGSGPLLRCETSPVPFAPYDVGVPLSGRDTGGSQLFVTLSRTPHLDGAYAWVGHAEGDWAALAEGDVIRDVRVEEE